MRRKWSVRQRQADAPWVSERNAAVAPLASGARAQSPAAANTGAAQGITPTSARQSRISYFNGSYGVSVDYRLTGFSAGSGLSHVDEVISITNATASPLEFHFFQYSDFNLGGAPGDSVRIGTDAFGRFNEALQTNGPIRLAESSVNLGANRAEANISPLTLTSLNDATITVLNNSTSAGPGDASWAFEWDLTIGAGGSVGFSKVKDVQIPEPSSAALILIGTLACAIYGRQRAGR